MGFPEGAVVPAACKRSADGIGARHFHALLQSKLICAELGCDRSLVTRSKPHRQQLANRMRLCLPLEPLRASRLVPRAILSIERVYASPRFRRLCRDLRAYRHARPSRPCPYRD